MTSTQQHTHHRSFWVRLPLLGLVAVACVTEPSVSLPEGAVQIAPRAQYQEWWDRTQACAGHTGTFADIEWYTVPDALTMATEIGEKVGLWIKEDGRTMIVIAGAYLDHELVVRHEMLHDLLQREGHPEEFFVARCGLTWESWDVASGH